jgi:hypothetical protein
LKDQQLIGLRGGALRREGFVKLLKWYGKLMKKGMMPEGARACLCRNASTARNRSTAKLMIPIPIS